MARPIILTARNLFTTLPANEALQISDGVDPSDAVTLGQMTAALEGFSGGDIDLTGYATEEWVRDLLNDYDWEGIMTTVAWENITNKPLTFPPSEHTHNEFYTKLEVDSLISSAGLTANGLGFFVPIDSLAIRRYSDNTGLSAQNAGLGLRFNTYALRCRTDLKVKITHLQKLGTYTTVPSVIFPDSIPDVKTEIEPVTVLDFSFSHTDKTGSISYGGRRVGTIDFGYYTHLTNPDAGNAYINPALLTLVPVLYVTGVSSRPGYDTAYNYWATLEINVFDLDTGLQLCAQAVDNHHFIGSNTFHGV